MVATMWDDTLISQHINSYHLQSHDVTPALQYITNLHTSFYRRTTGVLTDLIQAAVPQTSRPIFLVPVGDIYKRNLRNTELTVKGISKPCVISYLTTTFTLKKTQILWNCTFLCKKLHYYPASWISYTWTELPYRCIIRNTVTNSEMQIIVKTGLCHVKQWISRQWNSWKKC